MAEPTPPVTALSQITLEQRLRTGFFLQAGRVIAQRGQGSCGDGAGRDLVERFPASPKPPPLRTQLPAPPLVVLGQGELHLAQQDMRVHGPAEAREGAHTHRFVWGVVAPGRAQIRRTVWSVLA